MITQRSYRRDVNDRRFTGGRGELLSTTQRTVMESMRSVVHYELGYGGHIVAFTDTMLETCTPVFSKVDHTIFEGSKEDMAELLKIAAIFELMRGSTPEDRQKRLGDMYDQLVERWPDMAKPLYLTHAFPLFSGKMLEIRTLIAYLAETEDDIHLLKGAPTDYLYELIGRRLEGQSMDQLRPQILSKTQPPPEPC